MIARNEVDLSIESICKKFGARESDTNTPVFNVPHRLLLLEFSEGFEQERNSFLINSNAWVDDASFKNTFFVDVLNQVQVHRNLSIDFIVFDCVLNAVKYN